MVETLCDICKWSGACGCVSAECIRYEDKSQCSDEECTVYQPCVGDDEAPLDGYYEQRINFYDQPQVVVKRQPEETL